MFLVNADSKKVTGVAEARHVPTPVGQQPVELERAPGKSEHPICRIALVEERLPRCEGQCSPKALEPCKVLATEDPTNRTISDLASFARVTGWQTLVRARRRCKHFRSSHDLDQLLR
jgi:hypothetical protein